MNPGNKRTELEQYATVVAIKRPDIFYTRHSVGLTTVNQTNFWQLFKADFPTFYKALSVGFLPTGVARTMFPVNIFRINEKTFELVRDTSGLCVKVLWWR